MRSPAFNRMAKAVAEGKLVSAGQRLTVAVPVGEHKPWVRKDRGVGWGERGLSPKEVGK